MHFLCSSSVEMIQFRVSSTADAHNFPDGTATESSAKSEAPGEQRCSQHSLQVRERVCNIGINRHFRAEYD